LPQVGYWQSRLLSKPFNKSSCLLPHKEGLVGVNAVSDMVAFFGAAIINLMGLQESH
jgi:hypothetical protein